MPKNIFLSLLSPGSVVVEHDVILKAKFTPEYKENFNKAIQKLEENIMNATQENCTSKFLGFWGGVWGLLQRIFKLCHA